MPRHPAQGPRPLRSGHARAGRASRSAGQARSGRIAPAVRRRRRGSRRHDRRDSQSQSQARPRLRLHHGAADRAGRVGARGARRQLARRAEFRHAAESAHQPALLRAGRRRHAQRQGQDAISPTACRPPPGWCAPRSARQDHPQSVERDRAPAGRLLRQGRAASAPAQSEDRRRRHRHARSRPSRASPPTNTWRRRAASSN